MTPKQLAKLVHERASGQLPKVIDQTLCVLSQDHIREAKHTQGQSCWCPSCRLLQNYVFEKRRLHRMKQNINKYDRDYYSIAYDWPRWPSADTYGRFFEQKRLTRQLRKQWMESKKDILVYE